MNYLTMVGGYAVHGIFSFVAEIAMYYERIHTYKNGRNAFELTE